MGTALPGAAASTPIVWGKRVFLSGVDQARDMLQAMCLDRLTGKLLWSRDVAKGVRRDHRSNFASNSPATDGRSVACSYSATAICLPVTSMEATVGP